MSDSHAGFSGGAGRGVFAGCNFPQRCGIVGDVPLSVETRLTAIAKRTLCSDGFGNKTLISVMLVLNSDEGRAQDGNCL